MCAFNSHVLPASGTGKRDGGAGDTKKTEISLMPRALCVVERGWRTSRLPGRRMPDSFLEGRKTFDVVLVETFAGKHEGLGLRPWLLRPRKCDMSQTSILRHVPTSSLGSPNGHTNLSTE